MNRNAFYAGEIAKAVQAGFGERIDEEGAETELLSADVSPARFASERSIITVKLDNGRVFNLEVEEVFP